MKNVGANIGIWCCFEKAMSVVPDGKKLLLDVAAMSKGKAQLLTDGLTKQEEQIENDGTSAGTGWQVRSEVNNSLIIVNFFHKIQNFRQISDLFSQI